MLGLCLALGLLGSQASAAERAWIKGEVRLNLRSGPGTSYRILDGVKTGDVLTVLNRQESWTEVRTEAVEFDLELPPNLFTLSNLRNPRQ